MPTPIAAASWRRIGSTAVTTPLQFCGVAGLLLVFDELLYAVPGVGLDAGEVDDTLELVSSFIAVLPVLRSLDAQAVRAATMAVKAMTLVFIFDLLVMSAGSVTLDHR
ncbi:hypothetical protein GCM10027277_55960 [Pseudoduganella ginsengisoli]